jgi:hypothetical protein
MSWRAFSPALLLALLLPITCGVATARGNPYDTRRAEMLSCERGELATWPEGDDRPAAVSAIKLVYRHAGAAPAFDEATVLGTLQRAAAAWSACGIPAGVISEAAASAEPQVVTVLWSDTETRGNFALANLGQRRLALSAAMFALLAQRNPRQPAVQTLQMTVSHELGHFFGLVAHSRRCIDVMSYYTDASGATCFTRDGGSFRSVPEYRAWLPTACDIARCKAVNGLAR